MSVLIWVIIAVIVVLVIVALVLMMHHKKKVVGTASAPAQVPKMAINAFGA